MRAGAPTEQCSGRMALLELNMSSKNQDCDQILQEFASTEAMCSDQSGVVYPVHELALRRIRADASVLCYTSIPQQNADQSASRSRRDAAKSVTTQVLEDAVAVLNPGSARSWKRLCFALLMLQEARKKSTLHAGTREESFELYGTSVRRCFDALVRLEGKADPPWNSQLYGAVALMAAADHQPEGKTAHSETNASTSHCMEGYKEHVVESIKSRVRKARALVGKNEVCRLLHRLSAGMPCALAAAMSPYSQLLVAAVCTDSTGGAAARASVLNDSTVRLLFNLSADTQIVGIAIPLDPTTGWGNFGLQLVHELSISGRFYPLMLHAPSARLLRECRRVLASAGTGHHSHVSRLVASLVLQQGSWAADVIGDSRSRRTESGTGGREESPVAPHLLDFPVIHSSKRFFFGENETVWGAGNVAVVFFEETSDVQPHRLVRAARYDSVVLGCQWYVFLCHAQGEFLHCKEKERDGGKG